MKVLQSGIPKSGNVWVYRIINKVFEKSKIERKSFIRNEKIYQIAKEWDLSISDQVEKDVIDIENGRIYSRISSIYKMPIKNPIDFLSRTNLVWTHSKYELDSLAIYKKFSHHIYIYRDIRSVVVSMAHFLNFDYGKTFLDPNVTNPREYVNKNFYNFLFQWSRHIEELLKVINSLNVHTICFEDLKTNPQVEIKKITEFFNLCLTTKQIDEIAFDTSFSEMKKNDSKHLRSGSNNDWRNYVSSTKSFISNIYINYYFNCIKKKKTNRVSSFFILNLSKIFLIVEKISK